jgi:iron(III) transport system substrate-binding protein
MAGGCDQASKTGSTPPVQDRGHALLVYCSVDEAFARDVLKTFSAKTGIELSTLFDSEAGKTTGLVNKIIHEAASGRPRADVFWSSELFNTILLARRGLLEAYESPAAADIPPRFRDPEHRWTALAARARVLAFDPHRVQPTDVPRRWEQLGEPPFAGRVAFANPLFGTTRGHVAAMFALWGPERARAFLSGLRDGGVQITDGNSAAVRAVIAGRATFAATDTDDVWVARSRGASLDLVYPDMGDGGTLLIPCSVAIVADRLESRSHNGRSHNGRSDEGQSHEDGGRREAARKLVDFLVSAEVERMLAESGSRNIPVRESLRKQLKMPWPAESTLGFDAVADAMDEAVAAARDILIR